MRLNSLILLMERYIQIFRIEILKILGDPEFISSYKNSKDLFLF